MPRTRVRQRRDAEARLNGLEAANPGWLPLLGVLRETLATLYEPAPKLQLRLEPVVPHEPERPLLQGASIEIAARWPGRTVRRLARAARGRAHPAGDPRLDGAQALALLCAGLRDDGPALEAVAADSGIDVNLLATISRHAVVPLLVAATAAAPGPPNAGWLFGHCPFCAARPLLGEVRGLEQMRRLRCGRCGADWRGEWLRCVFCGENDHMRLGSLVPEGRTTPGRADACSACGGYLKVLNTLTPIPVFDLLLSDLETVELDLAARQRGFTRPGGLGFPLAVCCTVLP